jgi:hypothetical protein
MANAYSNENHSTHSAECPFDDGGERGIETRFRNVPALHDAHTIHYLKKRVIQEAWSCLEIGGGSIISWLGTQVGITELVLVAGVEPPFLQAPSSLNPEGCRHEIHKETLPTGEFELVPARFGLPRLPEPKGALRRMMAALKPGGRIVTEELDDLWLLPDPTVNPGEASLRARPAFQKLRTSAGIDPHYGRSLPQKLQSNGLVISEQRPASLSGRRDQQAPDC